MSNSFLAQLHQKSLDPNYGTLAMLPEVIRHDGSTDV